MLDLSVVIITLNEEARLPYCLASLPKGAEVVVVDSGSTDQTVALAKAAGCTVVQRSFDHYAGQKNAAIDLTSRSWIFAIDADEICSPELRDFLATIGQKFAPDADVYRIQRRLVFMNRQLRFGKTRDCPMRLFRSGSARFSGEVHESLDWGGAVSKVRAGSLAHHSYRDLTDYFGKFNRYTSLIAERRFAMKRSSPPWSHCLRPWGDFLGRYFLRLGFLDGYPGYCYALVSSLYAYVKYAKWAELSLQDKEHRESS